MNTPLHAVGRPIQGLTRDTVMSAMPDLGKLAQHLIDTGEVPGLSIAVVFRDEVVYVNGFGSRRAGHLELVDADTVFQLASLSKPLASTVVAAIVSGEKVTWETRIAHIDAGFQLYEAYPTAHVTIRDLFAHRSGLSGNAGNDLESLGFARDEILHVGQEAISNAFTHANASHIDVEITYHRRALTLKVRDDGTGVDTETLEFGRAGNFGLVGMRERARALGAILQMGSRSGAGTEIELLVPARVAYGRRR